MIEVKKFTGTMNSDSSESEFPAGDFLNAENIDILTAQDGSVISIKPVYGNRQVVYADLPVNAKIVGSFAEDEKNRLYYFVYDPAKVRHMILCYFKTQDYILKVFESDLLEFSGVPITGVDKVGNLLYWAEDNRQPKKVNVERGLVAFNATYLNNSVVPYDINNILFSDLTIIRPAPRFAPMANKITTNQLFGQTGDGAFQFATRYIYWDNEVSVLSPYSKLVNYNLVGETYDCIAVSLDITEKIPYEVKKVQLLVRLGNTGSFFIIKEWSKPTDQAFIDLHNNASAALLYNFFNNQNGVAVSEEESTTLFHNVPLYSRALAIGKNRLFLGNNTYGNTPYTGGTVTAKIDGIPLTSPTAVDIWGRLVMLEGKCTRIKINLLTGRHPVTTDTISFFVRIDNVNDTVNGYYDATSLITKDAFLAGTVSKVLNLTPDLKKYTLAQGDDDNFLAEKGKIGTDCLDSQDSTYIKYIYASKITRQYVGFTILGDVIVTGLTGTVASINQRAFKSASKYKIGVVFYDFAGRNLGTYTSRTAEVTIPQRNIANPIVYPNIIANLGFQSQDIPAWATSYQVVRTPNLTYSRFVQGTGRDIRYAGKTNLGVYTWGDDTTIFTETFTTAKVQAIAINISAIVGYGLGYAYNEGDVCTVFFNGLDQVETFRVIGQLGSYILVQARDIGALPLTGRPFIFEIASPRKGFLEETFYEVGANLPILNPGTATRSLAKDVVTIDGDIIIKSRAFLNGSAAVECMNGLDLKWEDWLTDVGRPNAVLPNARLEQRPTNIAFSSVFLSFTEVNGLSNFAALDQVDLDVSFGDLRMLVLTNRTEEFGSILLVICESETVSCYLSETRIVDNANNVIIASSGDAIGTVNALKGSYGTIHPESVAVWNGLVYYADAISGKVIQYSNNGLTPVSEYKMAKFFTSVLYGIGKTTRGLTGCIDRKTRQYHLTIPTTKISQIKLIDYDNQKSPYQITDNRTFVYNPDVNGWLSKTYVAEHQAGLTDSIISFKAGKLYNHDLAGTNLFYGTFYPSYFSFVLGSSNPMVKIPQNVILSAMSPADWTHMRSEIPYEQSSDLVPSEYRSYEGIWYAAVLRDRLTPGYDSREKSLIFGDRIRGQYLKVAFRYDTTPFFVNEVTIESDMSIGHQALNQ